MDHILNIITINQQSKAPSILILHPIQSLRWSPQKNLYQVGVFSYKNFLKLNRINRVLNKYAHKYRMNIYGVYYLRREDKILKLIESWKKT